ncbi:MULTISPECIES: sensor histidine kinase [Saccharothrix]|uniref:sensor histidine kinase n=1 Tax=Saccharothrix TaxID=2071 RepID=UPI00093CD4AC|nr:hypothetical protein A6A25_22690 [Saccharothrix sp. CB00851]
MDRVRIAVAAAVVAGALLASGAAWVVGQMELQLAHNAFANADRRAHDGAARLAGLIPTSGDRAHLRRVLRNLLDNAERHASSRVEVTVAVEGGTAVLRVSDDGPGIPEADRERVFEPFVRLDEGRARDEGGAGLGLAIVREGVHAHGGTVAIEDTDRGTTVAIRLPLA